jgi:hypothetical protein
MATAALSPKGRQLRGKRVRSPGHRSRLRGTHLGSRGDRSRLRGKLLGSVATDRGCTASPHVHGATADGSVGRRHATAPTLGASLAARNSVCTLARKTGQRS